MITGARRSVNYANQESTKNLSAGYIDGIKNVSPRSKDYFFVDHALIRRFQTRQTKRHQEILRLVSPEKESPLVVFYAAMFGIHHKDLGKEFFDVETQLKGTTTEEFIEVATGFVTEWQQSWLDMTALALSPRLLESPPLSPTVVLVGSKVSDLALFGTSVLPANQTIQRGSFLFPWRV